MDARPGFYFLICSDGQLLCNQLERLLSRHVPAHGQWERHTYWGDEEPPPRFWEQLTLQGLFGTPRVVVVRQAQLWPVAVWKRVSQTLARPSEQCWPFFCLEAPWEKNKPKIPAYIEKLHCLAHAKKQGWIWQYAGLDARAIKTYVRQRSGELGLVFLPDALERFCASVQPDARAIEGELDKLCRLIGAARESGGAGSDVRVTLAMTGTSGWNPDEDVFACIRHMEAGDLSGVWRELARSEDASGMFFNLLANLGREMNLLWRVQAGEDVYLHSSSAAFKRKLAARLGPEGIARAMSVLVDAEWHVKSGRRTPVQSLESMAVKMTALLGQGKIPLSDISPLA
ncbi:MAG: DNA polymerase III subunit delta [Desulfovibrio sp.]|nr:DNA polymerase III subunit delta [Desulfovibrio sp.]